MTSEEHPPQDSLHLLDHTLGLLHKSAPALMATEELDTLVHLCLSLLVTPNGGNFQNAILLMVNPRAHSMQGILGLNRNSVGWTIPAADHWEFPPELEQEQHETDFCQKAQHLRLSCAPGDNRAALAVLEQRAVSTAESMPESDLDRLLDGRDYICLPLQDWERAFAVLVVSNESAPFPNEAQRRFLQLFRHHAQLAMTKCRLLQKVEASRQDLNAFEERLIQQEKLATIGEMAASLAHELRNPLMAVGGFAALLQRQLEPKSQAGEYAGIITREIQRLEKLLNNILDFSKEQIACVEDYRLDSLLADILELELPTMLGRGVTLDTELAHKLPPLKGDSQQIRQVLLNLIRNALQAMSGGGNLTVRSHLSRLRGEPSLCVEVEDTGGGIPTNLLRNIFNPFFTTKEEGTGLGLSVCHRIIEHHHGVIEVVNKEHGACFKLHLPLHLAKADPGPWHRF